MQNVTSEQPCDHLFKKLNLLFIYCLRLLILQPATSNDIDTHHDHSASVGTDQITSLIHYWCSSVIDVASVIDVINNY